MGDLDADAPVVFANGVPLLTFRMGPIIGWGVLGKEVAFALADRTDTRVLAPPKDSISGSTMSRSGASALLIDEGRHLMANRSDNQDNRNPEEHVTVYQYDSHGLTQHVSDDCTTSMFYRSPRAEANPELPPTVMVQLSGGTVVALATFLSGQKGPIVVLFEQQISGSSGQGQVEKPKPDGDNPDCDEPTIVEPPR